MRTVNFSIDRLMLIGAVLCFHAAFFGPPWFWWLGPVAAFLWLGAMPVLARCWGSWPLIVRDLFCIGLAWAVPALWWIARLSLCHFETYGWMGLVWYVGAVLLLAVTHTVGSLVCIGVWQKACLMRLPLAICVALLLGAGWGYHCYLVHWSLLPIGRDAGCPLLSPFLPMAFIFAKASDAGQGGIIHPLALAHKPMLTLAEAEQDLLGALANCEAKEGLLCAGEGAFPFALEAFPETIGRLSRAVGSRQQLLLGSRREWRRGSVQALFLIDQEGICKVIEKSVLVPMAEEGLFVPGTPSGNREILVGPAGPLVPLICYEFFANPGPFLAGASPDAGLLVLIHDGWFDEPLLRWMEWYARWAAAVWGRTIYLVMRSGRLSRAQFSGSLLDKMLNGNEGLPFDTFSCGKHPGRTVNCD